MSYLAPDVTASPSPKASPPVVLTEKSCLQGHKDLRNRWLSKGIDSDGGRLFILDGIAREGQYGQSRGRERPVHAGLIGFGKE